MPLEIPSGAGLLFVVATGCVGVEPLPGSDDDPGAADAAATTGELDAAPPGAPDGGQPADGADAAPPSQCSGGGWDPGSTQTIQLTHAGMNRSYIVHVGSSVSPTAPTPLLMNFHGLTSNATQQLLYSGTNATADAAGFVVVYPQGVSSSFNAIGCCGSAAQQGVDDVGFALAIIEDVAAHACLDRKRVYATGMSNGGFMSYRLACSASHAFAAVAPVAGALASSDCQPGRPVPVLAFHGDADGIVSYASDQAAVATFRTLNGCAGQPVSATHGNVTCDRWDACAGGAVVELCTYPGLGHAWPMASTGHAATPALWEFLSQYSLP